MLVRFKDAFSSIYSTLFKSLRDTGSIWTGLTDDDASSLSEDYFYHSYDKLLNRKAAAWYGADPTTFLSKVVKDALARYKSNWNKVYEAYFRTDYKPLENYSMSEVRTPYLKQTTKTQTDFKTFTESKNAVYGFNSTTPVDASESTTDTNGSRLDNKQDIEVNSTGHEDLTRSGNIGVTTSQAMLLSEIDLRRYDYFKKVMEDLDVLICLNVY